MQSWAHVAGSMEAAQAALLCAGSQPPSELQGPFPKQAEPKPAVWTHSPRAGPPCALWLVCLTWTVVAIVTVTMERGEAFCVLLPVPRSPQRSSQVSSITGKEAVPRVLALGPALPMMLGTGRGLGCSISLLLIQGLGEGWRDPGPVPGGPVQLASRSPCPVTRHSSACLSK